MSCLPLNHAFQQPLRHVRQTFGRQKENIKTEEREKMKRGTGYKGTQLFEYAVKKRDTEIS
jgi:hypothetical protein